MTMTTTTKRLLWIVNHQTLMAAEVPILRSLGWEVFVPKVTPADPSYRSAGHSHEYDEALGLEEGALGVLNLQNFYQHPWSPTVESIINDNFDVAVTTISAYTMPLSEAARKFTGTVVARVFGREHPERYSEWPETTRRPALLSELSAIGDRFVFAQSYDNLAEIEDEPFRSRAHTVTVPLPPSIYERAGDWRGDGTDAIFLCPAINDTGYYAGVYREIKSLFGDLPHRIFGRQFGTVTDPAVLPFLTDADLFDLYAAAPVFVYPSAEPRHLHYSPIEAMVVGTPVVYRRGSLLDRIAGERLPGACADDAELRELTERLLAGDRDLAERIRAAQGPIVEAFSADLARSQWQALLAGVAA
jgi:hypothetical protein